jgi:hypothetical protein
MQHADYFAGPALTALHPRSQGPVGADEHVLLSDCEMEAIFPEAHMERCWPEQGKPLEGILANVRAAARFAGGLPPCVAGGVAGGEAAALQLVQQREGFGNKENQVEVTAMLPAAPKPADAAAHHKSGAPSQVIGCMGNGNDWRVRGNMMICSFKWRMHPVI